MPCRSSIAFKSLLAGAAFAFVASSCGGVNPAAMTVNGEEISADMVRGDVDGLAASKTFAAQNGAVRLDDGVYESRIMAAVLRQRFFGTVFQQELAKRKIQPQPVSTEMQAQAEQAIGGKEIFAETSAVFQKQLISQTVNQFTLRDALKREAGTAASYFAAHKAEFAETCISHILVADLATAESARRRIVGGEAFAGVATALSTDTGSKVNGGVLGCGPTSQFVPEFAKVAASLPINELSVPVKTQFGYHLIRVTKRTDKPFAEVKAAVDARLDTVPTERLEKMIRTAKVTVNPKFGVYVADGGEGFPAINPAGTKTTVAP